MQAAQLLLTYLFHHELESVIIIIIIIIIVIIIIVVVIIIIIIIIIIIKLRNSCTTYLAECGQKLQQVLPNLLFHIYQAAPQQLNRPAVSSLL